MTSPSGNNHTTSDDNILSAALSKRYAGYYESEGIFLTGHTDWVLCVCLSTNNDRIASGSSSDDCSVRIWERNYNQGQRNWKASLVLKGHTRYVNCVLFASTDDKILLSASGDFTIIAWDSITGAILHTFTGHTCWVNDMLLLDRSSEMLVSTSDDKTIRVWNIITGKEVTMHDTQSLSFCLALSKDKKQIISGHGDPYPLMIWDAQSFYEGDIKPVKTVPSGHQNYVWRLSYSGNGKYLASASVDSMVHIFSVDDGSYDLVNILEGHEKCVWCVTFILDTNILVSTSGDKTIKIWNVEEEEPIKTLTTHSNYVNSVACSSDGNFIVTASSDKSVMITMRDVVDVEELFGDIKNASTDD